MSGKHQSVEPDPAARARKPAAPPHREAARPIAEPRTIQAATLAALPGKEAQARARHAANLQRQMGNAYVSRLIAPPSADDGPTTLVDRATGPVWSSQPIEIPALPHAREGRAEAASSSKDRSADGDDGHLTPVQRSAIPDLLRGPGRPLDEPTRADMETRLGADFSDVRVHTDAAARGSAAEIGSRAYTSGHHIVIGEGGTDRHTLAHELTHVIQQRQGPVAGIDRGDGVSVSDPSDRFERRAEANARRAMSGPQPAWSEAPGAVNQTGTAVQRTTIGGQIATTVVEAEEVWHLMHRVWNSATPAAQQEAVQAIKQRNGWDDAQMAAHGQRQFVWNLADVLLDPAYDFEGSLALADELIEGIGPEQGLELLRRDILDPVNFAACYPTAEHLFPLLTGVIANEGESRADLAHRAAGLAEVQGKSNDVEALPDGDAFRAEVGRLTTAIQTANLHNQEGVFRIEFAGHGFTLILRHPAPGQPLHIELIESLAHGASMDLSLRHPGREVQGTIRALTEMADDNYETRRRGALFMGWNAAALFLHDTGPDPQNPVSSYPDQRARGENAHIGEYFPRTRMKWWASPLSPAAGGLWYGQAATRFARLSQVFPGHQG